MQLDGGKLPASFVHAAEAVKARGTSTGSVAAPVVPGLRLEAALASIAGESKADTASQPPERAVNVRSASDKDTRKVLGWCRVKFRVQARTSEDQYLCIVGNCEELGNWAPLQGTLRDDKS